MSIGTSFKTIDVSAFFTALMMRDVRRGILNMRSNDFMTWRLYFMLAVLIMVFAFAHILALQKLNAMQSERAAAVLDVHSD
jgi:putative component of toxin-antitoxin plasmid stabilization module